jgi:membrane protein DedA with SNARE-associated domain
VETLAILFVIVLLINLMPAFAPPTWMAMSWVGFKVPEGSPLAFAFVAAGAATLGRLILASCARRLVRGRLMRESDRENIDVVRAWLEKHRTLTVGAFFLYSFSPFPSNYLFIAYGLSGMPLVAIGAAFFVGRTVSYAAWTHLGRLASAFVDTESQFEGRYLSGYFVVTQIVLLGLVYILMKLDWKMLLECRRLVWRRPVKSPAEADQHHSPHH